MALALEACADDAFNKRHPHGIEVADAFDRCMLRARSVTVETQIPHDCCDELVDTDDPSSADEKSVIRCTSGPEASQDPWEMLENSEHQSPLSTEACAVSHDRIVLLRIREHMSQHESDSEPHINSMSLPRCLRFGVKSSLSEVSTKASIGSEDLSRKSLANETDAEDQVNNSLESQTMMLRNIPNRTTCAAIARRLLACGFGGTYDLLYVPIDRTTGNLNLGYAFVNFRQSAASSRFADMFNNKSAKELFPASCSDKVLKVSLATVQGRDAYLDRLSSMVWPTGSDAWRPVVYDDDGRPIRLPTARPSLPTQPANIPRASFACKTGCPSALRADAPKFMATAGGQNMMLPDRDGDILDPHFPRLPAYIKLATDRDEDSRDPHFACLPAYVELANPCLAGCGYKPEMYMAATVGVTEIEQSGHFHDTNHPGTGSMPFKYYDGTRATSAPKNSVAAGSEHCGKGAMHTANNEQTFPSKAPTTGKYFVDLATAAAFAFVAGVIVAGVGQKAIAMEL